MAFQVSPGVNVSEIDLTAVVPAVQTTAGGLAGRFRWGPVKQRVVIDSEDRLVSNFQTPNNDTATDFFSAANFLAYTNQLFVVRVVNESDTLNATVDAANTVLVKNEDHYEENFSSGFTDNVGEWVAKFPGALGNSLKISVCPSSDAFSSTLSNTYSVTNGGTTVTFGANLASELVVGDQLVLGPDREVIRVSAVAGNTATLETSYTGNTVTTLDGLERRWEYFNFFDRAPSTTAFATTRGGSNDMLHVAVIDEDGEWTGTRGQVIERFEGVSFANDAKTENGSTNYYKNVINQQSSYVWFAKHNDDNTNAGSAASSTFTGDTLPQTQSFTGGADGSAPTNGEIIKGYDLFRSSEDVDIGILIGSGANQTIATHLINNIAEVRRDLVVTLSPERADVVDNSSYDGAEQEDIVAYRNLLPSTSYATMDSGWKYQYDKYNDVYRYVPLNGDVAGTIAQTDLIRDPWFSPAGFQRGQIKNVIKLAYNPRKADRDILYKNGINPVTSFPGQGTVLFGDKTLLALPSAFDRINVRRLFITLEKAIAAAAQGQLFEFNDEVTRTQFVNLVRPFLRDVQNFVAVRTGVEFSEVVGAV